LVLEDVPERIKDYGDKKVAFFSTNCSLQVPLQAAILELPNAYYPQPCCPSPYHGFPSSLGLELNMEDGNEAALRTVAAKLQEHDAVGRYSTWAAPVVMADVAVLVKYAMGYIEGTIEGRNNTEALLQLFEETMPAKVQPYTDAEGVTYDNYYMVLLEPVDFNDYL